MESNLFNIRTQAGLSLRRLAELCDFEISASHLQRIENGGTVPTIEKCFILADALNVAIEELFIPTEKELRDLFSKLKNLKDSDMLTTRDILLLYPKMSDKEKQLISRTMSRCYLKRRKQL